MLMVCPGVQGTQLEPLPGGLDEWLSIGYGATDANNARFNLRTGKFQQPGQAAVAQKPFLKGLGITSTDYKQGLAKLHIVPGGQVRPALCLAAPVVVCICLRGHDSIKVHHSRCLAWLAPPAQCQRLALQEP